MTRHSAPWIVSLSLIGVLVACKKQTEVPPEPAAEPSAKEAGSEVSAQSSVEVKLVPAAEVEVAKVDAPPETAAGELAIEVAGAGEPQKAADAAAGPTEPSGDKPEDAKEPEKKKSDKKKSGDKAEEPPKVVKPKFTELGVELSKAGSGTAATAGKRVTIHYRASLADAEKPFDSTFAAHRPLEIQLGPDAKLQVIEGLRRGLEGLMPGSEVRLQIPANLAWGEKGNPAVGVPANADVVFEVHVLDVQ